MKYASNEIWNADQIYEDAKYVLYTSQGGLKALSRRPDGREVSGEFGEGVIG